MDIIYDNTKNEILIEDVKMGKVFIYKNRVYMKLGEYTNLDYNAIRLRDGIFEKLGCNSVVEVVNCELKIKK